MAYFDGSERSSVALFFWSSASWLLHVVSVQILCDYAVFKISRGVSRRIGGEISFSKGGHA